MGREREQEEVLSDMTRKENWDKFYTTHGTDDSFEWYSEWAQIRGTLLPLLLLPPDTPSLPRILVPGCGNSSISHELYDHGFKLITNIDFSQVVVSDMVARHATHRPLMQWLTTDMTCMQFEDETFDIVLDKGGLDALMEAKSGTKLGNQYLSEVKRVLNPGGKFICLTLAESHILGLFLPIFRYGWKMSVHVIPTNPSDKSALCTFMIIAEKEQSPILHQISSKLIIPSHILDDQVRGLINALKHENKVREECSTGLDILYSLEDLKLGAIEDLRKLEPGRRAQLTLGDLDFLLQSCNS